MKINPRLHYYIRTDASGNPVLGTLIARNSIKPPVGRGWIDITTYARLCCNVSYTISANDVNITIANPNNSFTGNVLTLANATVSSNKDIMVVPVHIQNGGYIVSISAEGAISVTMNDTSIDHQIIFNIVLNSESAASDTIQVQINYIAI